VSAAIRARQSGPRGPSPLGVRGRPPEPPDTGAMGIVVVNHLSLDGVIQGPARPDEDTRGGFTAGGWADEGGGDPELGPLLGEAMGPDFAWLFGRRSYDDMLEHWNAVGGPFRDGLNGTQKYVVSSHADAELPWPNSTLVTGDVPARVAELRDEAPGNLVVMGSGNLVRSLLPHGLVDELLLMIHPVVLGGGMGMFGPVPTPARFALVSSAALGSGMLVTRYRRTTA
jgi:dihydrofolate reductase